MDLNTVWDEQTITNVTPSVTDVSKQRGRRRVHDRNTCYKGDTCYGFHQAKKVGMMVKSDVAASSGDLRALSMIRSSAYIIIYRTACGSTTRKMPSKLNHFKSVGRPTYVYWYDKSATKWYQLYNARDGNTSNYSDLTLDTDDLLYICYDQPMTQITIDLGTAVNNNTLRWLLRYLMVRRGRRQLH